MRCIEKSARSPAMLLLLLPCVAAFAPLARSPTVPRLQPAIAPRLPTPITPSQRAPPVAMRYVGGGPPGFNPRDLIGPVVLFSLFASGALGWIFNGIIFLTLLPLVLGPIFSWYVQSNLLEGTCPECGAPAQVFKGQRGGCFACGASYSSELQNGVFMRDGGAAREDGVVEIDVLVDDDDYRGPRW